MLQREHADRHALEPVDVKGFDGAAIVIKLGRRAGQHDHAARGIRVDHGFRLGVWLEQVGHLHRRHVTKREHAHFIAATVGTVSKPRRQLAGQGVFQLQNGITTVFVNQSIAGPRQQGFQNRHRLVGTYRARRGERHIAADVGRDDVVLLQHFAEDGFHHGLDGLVLEIERHVATTTTARSRRTGSAFVDELASAGLDFGLGLFDGNIVPCRVHAHGIFVRRWQRSSRQRGVVGGQRTTGRGGRRAAPVERVASSAAGDQRQRRHQQHGDQLGHQSTHSVIPFCLWPLVTHSRHRSVVDAVFRLLRASGGGVLQSA